MAGPGIFNRTRIPLDSEEPIPDSTESSWKSKAPLATAAPEEPLAEPPEPLPPGPHHGAGKAKARKVGKPPEEAAPPLGPPKPERRICQVALRASGAGQESCNQDYRYCGLHQGKPMFKADNGAVIYFNKFWKMNKIYKTTGWIYCVKDSAGPWPAEGRWSSEGTSDPNGAGRPPSLVLIDEPMPRQVAEESTAYILEDGQKVLKREENKSWRWNEVLVRSKEDILRSLLEPREERPSGLVSGFLEPTPAAPAPVPAPVRPERPKAKAKDPNPAPSAPRPPADPPAPRPAPAQRPAPEPRPAPVRRGPPAPPEAAPERFSGGASARRFRPSSSTRESLAMAVAERKAQMARLEEGQPLSRRPEPEPRRTVPAQSREAQEDEEEDAAELMVGGNVFRVRRLEQGDSGGISGAAPASLQSMLAFIDAEDAAGYPQKEELREPQVKVADCPDGPADRWSVEEVSQYLDFLGLSHIEEKFKENAVDGAMLMELTEEDLCKELGLLKLQAKKLLSRLPRDGLPTAG